jgi:hypothetical protein
MSNIPSAKHGGDIAKDEEIYMIGLINKDNEVPRDIKENVQEKSPDEIHDDSLTYIKQKRERLRDNMVFKEPNNMENGENIHYQHQ